MSQVVVSGVRRLSSVSEKDTGTDVGSDAGTEPGESDWAGSRSRSSLCSHEKASTESITLTSSESHQPDAGEDCAVLLLACLYCRFSDIVLMLPGACERALGRCFPSYRYFAASHERDPGKDSSSCSLEVECSLLDTCHETNELLELAMEISEICYR